jgi:hypothetical protein
VTHISPAIAIAAHFTDPVVVDDDRHHPDAKTLGDDRMRCLVLGHFALLLEGDGVSRSSRSAAHTGPAPEGAPGRLTSRSARPPAISRSSPTAVSTSSGPVLACRGSGEARLRGRVALQVGEVYGRLAAIENSHIKREWPDLPEGVADLDGWRTDPLSRTRW